MNSVTVSPIDRFLVIFPSIVYEALPFIVIGALISGALEELLPQQTFARMIPKRRWLAIMGSALLGMIFPMCECGIVPVMRRLLGKGLPLSCAVAYMLAAPIINPVVIGSTWAAFSGDRSVETGGDGLTSFQMVSLRVSMAFLVAVSVGLVVNRRQKQLGLEALVRPVLGSRDARMHRLEHELHEHDHAQCEHDHDDGDHNHGHHHHHNPVAPAAGGVLTMAAPEKELAPAPAEAPRAWGQRLMNISETALRDFVDITCFLIIGAALAALVQTFGVMEALPQLGSSAFLAAPAMMLLAVLLCLCSEADAFVAANLIMIPLAGKLAFLVLGPMLDLKLYLMYTRVFKSKLIWTIIPCVVALVLVLSLAAHFLMS